MAIKSKETSIKLASYLAMKTGYPLYKLHWLLFVSQCSYKHNSPIWDPYQHKLILLEMIQYWEAGFVLNQPWSKHYHDSISEIMVT